MAPAALYVVGLGITSLFVCPKARRTSLVMIGVGAGWFALVTEIGADGGGGGNLGSWYGYLTTSGDRAHTGLGSVLSGAVLHPAPLAQMFGSRWPIVFAFVAVVGLVGVVHPWGLFPSAVVFLPTIFNADPAFLRPEQSFQSWPALPFVLIGSITIVVGWADRGRSRSIAAILACTVWATMFTVITVKALPRVPAYWLSVSNRAASHLAGLEKSVPTGAEVLAVNGVIGRFAARPFVYLLAATHSRSSFPVREPIVVFVITSTQGVAEPVFTTNTVKDLEGRPGTTVLVDGDGILGLEWTPRPGIRHVSLP